jgi:hypothetical protein
LLHLLVFYGYINEIHDSRSKIPSIKSRQVALRAGINSGVKVLKGVANTIFEYIEILINEGSLTYIIIRTLKGWLKNGCQCF